MPTLTDLLQEPQRAAELPPEAVTPLMAQCAALQSTLAARLATVQPVSFPPPSPQDTERLLTVPEVAEVLGVHPSYVYEVARSGKLPIVRLGKYVRIAPSALREWLAERGQQKGLDNRINVTLNSTYDWTRSSPNPQATRAHASQVRQARRRTPRHGESVGVQRPGDQRISRQADPATGCPGSAEG